MTLPDKPSALLRLALRDLEACERDTRYIIDMQDWHEPRGDLCHVCLSGAVMTQSLAMDRFYSCNPADFDHELASKLEALDEARVGSWRRFGLQLDLALREERYGHLLAELASLEVYDYHEDRDGFKDFLSAAARLFEFRGL